MFKPREEGKAQNMRLPFQHQQWLTLRANSFGDLHGHFSRAGIDTFVQRESDTFASINLLDPDGNPLRITTFES